MEMIDRLVSPLDVVSRSGRALHAFQKGVRYRHEKESLWIESLDAPLVAPRSSGASGDPRLFDFSAEQPELQHGFHFNLYNNKWGANHPAWLSEDTRFRFGLHFDKSALVGESTLDDQA